jgi:hypothetical protein
MNISVIAGLVFIFLCAAGGITSFILNFAMVEKTECPPAGIGAVSHPWLAPWQAIALSARIGLRSPTIDSASGETCCM